MKKLYNWLLEKSKHPHARWYLGLISFAESSVSFIPPDPLLIPMIIADKRKAWSLAFLTSLTSVLGGVVGYAIGFYGFQKFGVPILQAYGLMDKLHSFQAFFHEWGFWAIVMKAFTPIPFKLATITAGALKFDFYKFLLASALSRSIRFYLEAALLWYFGEKINTLIQKNMLLVSTSFIILLIAGFYLVKYIC